MTETTAITLKGPTSRAPSEAAGYIELVGVSKSFDGILAVNNVDLTIRKGELFALLG